MSERVREWLRQIDEAVLETFDVATRERAKQKAGSRRNAYEKGLREVRDVAGTGAATELAAWIEEEIRTERRFPSARDVRQRGAEICRHEGHEVSTGSWLGA